MVSNIFQRASCLHILDQNSSNDLATLLQHDPVLGWWHAVDIVDNIYRGELWAWREHQVTLLRLQHILEGVHTHHHHEQQNLAQESG